MIKPESLRELRIEYFKTQRALADAMGVGRSSVACWEHAHRPIPRWAVKFLLNLIARKRQSK